MSVDSLELSIVVPVYRSEGNLPELVAQIDTALSQSDYAENFELVLVNDCSPDDSWRVIENLAEQRSWVRGVSLRKNSGQHNATMAGLRFSRGNIIVVMDDDLQHSPSEILNLCQAIRAGNDVCYTRYVGRKHAAWKKIGSNFNDRVASWVLKKPRGLYLSSFKAFRREIADAIIAYDGPFTYVDGLILEVTNSIVAVDINHQDRFAGRGNYNLRRSISLWLKMATGSSVYPLRVATLAGFGVAAFSALVLMTITVERLLNPSMEPGWASVIATMLLMGGLQMVFMGILGEYVGRIYIRVNRSPQFVLAKTTFEK